MKVIEIQDGDIWADVEEVIVKSSLPFNKELYMILLWSVYQKNPVLFKNNLAYPLLGSGNLIRFKLQHEPQKEFLSVSLTDDTSTLKRLPGLSNL